MGTKDKLVRFCICERCGCEWIPEDKNNLPETCSKCRSPYWNKPRKAKKQPVKSPIKPKPIVKPKPVENYGPEPGTPEWEAQRKKKKPRGRGGIFGTSARRD